MTMNYKHPNNRGFTLVEIIASLFIIGMIASIAGMGIVQLANGFIFSKKNAETVQKAQIVMSRLVKELTSDTILSSGTSIAIIFTNSRLTGSHQIRWDNATKQLLFDENTAASDEVILTDDVNAFDLKYYDSYSTPSSPSTSYSAASSIIEITLELDGAGDTSTTFTDRVFLRD
ncbi:MAG: hypothetical protein B6245_02595 [Desulfobacteraceae bacterium 4572_88]|nr:MAG: hypothetical protein B6245_02595 [Desulfobacteraceae bacterium 4572_88]RLC21592.1 MAG: hypothetical protein DRI57_01955 [Deltaproteobacteria bacterium]